MTTAQQFINEAISLALPHTGAFQDVRECDEPLDHYEHYVRTRVGPYVWDIGLFKLPYDKWYWADLWIKSNGRRVIVVNKGSGTATPASLARKIEQCCENVQHVITEVYDPVSDVLRPDEGVTVNIHDSIDASGEAEMIVFNTSDSSFSAAPARPERAHVVADLNGTNSGSRPRIKTMYYIGSEEFRPWSEDVMDRLRATRLSPDNDQEVTCPSHHPWAL